MARQLKSIKESIAEMKALKNLTESELEKLATSAEIPGMPVENPANTDAVTENSETGSGFPEQDEILQRIETATEELDKEMDNQELSTEIKEGVKKFLKLKEEQIRKILENEFANKQEEFEEQLVDQQDALLNRAANEWLNENKVALKESIKVARVDKFIAGFKKLLEDTNIELPADAEAEIEKYKEENDDLRDDLNVAVTENYKISKALKESRKALLIERKISASGLSMTSKDKLRKLCESVEFDGDEEKFETELNTKEISEENTGQATPEVKVVQTPSELENQGLDAGNNESLAEAISKIRGKK